MSRRLADRVLLIGWDAADWRFAQPLLERGLMPNLQRFVDQGVTGKLSTLFPVISPILWTSVATGKRADKHRILGFIEPDGDGSIRPVSSTSRKAKTLWNIVSQCGLRATVVNWYASHPAEPIRGSVVSDRYGAVGQDSRPGVSFDRRSVHPESHFDPLSALRLSKNDITVDQVLPFIPEAHRIRQPEDQRLPALCELLAECATVHNAATWLLESERCDFMAVLYGSIDHFGHAFMEYHPPKMDHVSQEDFEIYRNVMTACYAFHDMMLGRLLELAGPETTVILMSDHGFANSSERPSLSIDVSDEKRRNPPGANPIAWHRRHGILAMLGPGIKADELAHGASLLDIAPTVLALLGVAIPDDMDGKPLTQTLTEQVDLDHLPTYEEEHPDDGVLRGTYADDHEERRLVLERLIDLGYVERPGDDQARAVETTLRDHQLNLAQVLQGAGRHAEAVTVLRRLLEQASNPHLTARLAVCLISLGRFSEAEAALTTVKTAGYPLADLLYGQMCSVAGRTDEALAIFERLQALQPDLPNLHEQLGETFLRREEWEQAAAAFRKALEIDDDNAEAHDGLGSALRRLGKPEDALLEHMRSVTLEHHRPLTHINLGLVLAELNQTDWAIRAFEVAAGLVPDLPFPHKCLAELYGLGKRDIVKAREHSQIAEQLQSARSVAGQ